MGMNVIFGVVGHLADRYRSHAKEEEIAMDQSHLELLDRLKGVNEESHHEMAEALTQKIEEVKEVIKVRMERA